MTDSFTNHAYGSVVTVRYGTNVTNAVISGEEGLLMLDGHVAPSERHDSVFLLATLFSSVWRWRLHGARNMKHRHQQTHTHYFFLSFTATIGFYLLALTDDIICYVDH